MSVRDQFWLCPEGIHLVRFLDCCVLGFVSPGRQPVLEDTAFSFLLIALCSIVLLWCY